jgi:anti-sigma factor (TIGR02949 family)
MKCEEAQELITALADNELPEQERYSIEDHLKDCRKCQLTYEQERVLKEEIRRAGASLKAPADLRKRILSDRRIVDERAKVGEGWKSLFWPAKMIPHPAFVGVLLLILVIPALYLMWPTEKSVALAALQTHEKIVGGAFPITKAGSPQEVKELLFRSPGGTFAPMEYDFSILGLQAVGGFVQEVGGRKVLVTVYQGKGPPISCFTFLGTEKDAPTDAAIFFDAGKDKNFYTFSQGRINGVMQRVGGRICILVSEIPLQDLIALARFRA